MRANIALFSLASLAIIFGLTFSSDKETRPGLAITPSLSSLSSFSASSILSPLSTFTSFSNFSSFSLIKSAAASETPNEKTLTVLKVPYPENPSGPSVYMVGQELGFFQKRGLDFDFVGVVPATQLVASVISGKLDIGGAHINRTIAGISAGAKILAVVANTETTERFPHMTGVVRKDSPLRKPADFIGKKIGISLVGGCHEYTPYAWMDKNGIKDPKSKVQIIVLSRNALEQALRQGEIDLAMLHKMPEEITRKGEFDVIFSDYDVWGPNGGATPNYFSLQFIQERPEAVKNFVAAMAETLDWANQNPFLAREITSKRLNYDINLINQIYYSPKGLLKPIHAEVWVDLLVEFDEIKPGITVDQIFTNKFNPYNEVNL